MSEEIIHSSHLVGTLTPLSLTSAAFWSLLIATMGEKQGGKEIADVTLKREKKEKERKRECDKVWSMHIGASEKRWPRRMRVTLEKKGAPWESSEVKSPFYDDDDDDDDHL